MNPDEVILKPQSIEAERALLGAVIIDPDQFAIVQPLLLTDFYDQRHQAIWSAIEYLANNDRAVDFATIVARLEELRQLEIIGGAQYIVALASQDISVFNAESYAHPVLATAFRRGLTSAGLEIANMAHNTGLEPVDLAEAAERILHIHTRNDRLLGRKRVTNYEVGLQASELVDGLVDKRKDANYIATGFRELEDANMTLGKGLNVAVLGASQVGKSSFTSQLTLNMVERGYRVLTVPLEMPPKRVMLRMAQASTEWTNSNGEDKSGVTTAQIEAASEAYLAITERIGELMHMENLLWTTQEQSSVAAVEAELARLSEESGDVDVVVIDSVQKLDDIVNAPRTEELVAHKKTWTKLARLALKRNILVVGVSEFNKTGGLNRRPKLDDIPQGGHHELDIVMGLYREHYAQNGEEVPSVQTLEVEGLKVRYSESNKIAPLKIDRARQRLW